MKKKETCVTCSKVKGKRICRLNDNLIICSTCCAKIRTTACKDCIHYIQSTNYTKGKPTKQNSKPFIMAISPEIDQKVDNALELVDKGKKKDAESILSTLIKEHPNIATVQYGMGVLCLIKKQYDKALPYFDKAIEINPYFSEAWYNKGNIHQQNLEVHHMIRAFLKVIEVGDPSEGYVIHARDTIREVEETIIKTTGISIDEYLDAADIFHEACEDMENNELERAILGFKKVLSKNPLHNQSYGNLGLCFAYLGKKQDALSNLDKALEIDPDYEPAIINRKYISSMKDGEKMPCKKIKSISYYRDFTKKKTFFSRIFGKS